MDDRLVLWDVDGTLMSGGPVHAEAVHAAIERAVGRTTDGHGVHMGGMTDPQIVREILLTLDVAEADVDLHVPAILKASEEAVAGAAGRFRAEGRLLPGVARLVERLDRSRPAVLQSLLTGNLASVAAVKLAAFGLDRWIDAEVGAYGSDHADRLTLVPVSLDRVARLRGRRFSPQQVWIVGDTPADLACARAAGARALLVATGRFSVAELAGCHPDALFPDLADTDAVLEVLRS